MEGGALFNSGVLGTNFLWWIGQIADDSTWRDNILPGKFESADSIPGWGRRYKVRVMGVHDQGETAIEPENLPWANVMYPITAGGGLANAFQTCALRQGMFVFGFWMDGQNMQTPFIMGVLGNNAQTPLPTGKIKYGVTNTSAGNLAYSGFATGEEPKLGTAKEKVPDEALVTQKPKPADIAKEGATPPPGVTLNKYGLRSDQQITKAQQADIESAQALAQAQGLNAEDTTAFVKKKVQQGVKNRVGAANQPNTPPTPGATKENPDGAHQLSAGDVKREDKYREKIVLMKPDDIVGSATKSIQIEIDNLTSKVDKYLGSLEDYIDAVTGPPSKEQLDKEIGLTACKVSKFMKIIMDKMMEYTSKSLNKELQATAAALPSSMRYLFGDQKFQNTTDTMKQYNEMTEKMCGNMEAILGASLGLEAAVEKVKARSSTGLNFADASSQEAVETLDVSTGKNVGINTVSKGASVTKPKVPICFAEDVIGNAISGIMTDLTNANNGMVNNYNRFISDMSSQLQAEDQKMKETAYNKTDLGKVVKITDEEDENVDRGGSQYFTQAGCAVTGGTGSGLKVNIVVPSGGLFDNDKLTINDGGTGYTASGGGASGTKSNVSVSGGSGTGLKIDYTVSSGVITGITTATTADNNGSNYQAGDIVTVTGGNSDCTFSLDRVRGAVETIENGGIAIADPGSGYTMGDFLTVVQDGSGNNCAFVVLTVIDPGEAKATAGPVTPGDKAGSVADALPDIGQKLGEMIPPLGDLTGNLTQALEFANVKANLFPFEIPPNPAMSDYYTLTKGSGAADDSEVPSADAVTKATKKPRPQLPVPPEIPFAQPPKGLRDIAQAAKQIGLEGNVGGAFDQGAVDNYG